MWRCVKCAEKLEDDFDTCWNCGTSSAGVEVPGFRKADEIAASELNDPLDLEPKAAADDSTAIRSAPSADKRERMERPPLDCPRCARVLSFVGTKSFHEGFQWGGLLGDLGEFFVNKENFDVFVCPRCGRVELYVSGLGEEFRPRKVDG